MARAQYVTNCVNSTARLICPMVDDAKEITFSTFARRVDWTPIAIQLGYLVGRGVGLRLQDDWSVSFHRSRFNGRPCYYLRWSAIEYVFQVKER